MSPRRQQRPLEDRLFFTCERTGDGFHAGDGKGWPQQNSAGDSDDSKSDKRLKSIGSRKRRQRR
jgi:hypothetical protein